MILITDSYPSHFGMPPAKIRHSEELATIHSEPKFREEERRTRSEYLDGRDVRAMRYFRDGVDVR